MKKLLVLAVLLLATLAVGQGPGLNTSAVQCGPLTSGTACPLLNVNGAGTINLEYVFSGSPTTVSVVVQGCMTGNTCDTLDTYTGTTSTNRRIDISTKGPYPRYIITPTFSGGTNPSIKINGFGTIARSGGGSAAQGMVNQIQTATGGTPNTLQASPATTDSSGAGVFPGGVTAGVAGSAGGVIKCPEGTAPAAASGFDILYCDAASHTAMLSLNGGTFYGLMTTNTAVAAAQLPAPAASTLGGTKSIDCTGTGHVLKIDTTGTPACSADAAGGAANANELILFGTGLTNANKYFGVNGTNGTQGPAKYLLAHNRTFTNIQCNSSNTGSAGNFVMTLEKNGVTVTGAVCTISGTNSTCAASFTAASFTGGTDYIDIAYTYTSTPTNSNVFCTVW